MNRWLVSGFALVIGVSGSFAAVSASRPVNNRDGDILGPIDFDTYCDDVHGPRSAAVGDSSNAYGWKCARQMNGLFTTPSVDYDEACARQYGEPSYAVTWDAAVSLSWQCFFGSGG